MFPNMYRRPARPKWGMEDAAKCLSAEFRTINGMTKRLRCLPQVALSGKIHHFERSRSKSLIAEDRGI